METVKFARMRLLGWLAAVSLVGLAAGTRPVSACPFCSNMGKTLAENVAEAGMVVHGRLANAKLIPDAPAGQPDGATDLEILTVVKSHALLEGKKKIVLPRFIPAAEKETVEYLIFAEVVDGRIDPYRGMPVDSKELVDYLVGSVKLTKAKPLERLPFFFHYLDHYDTNISGDAYKEFSNAPYSDVVAAAKGFEPAKLITWLKDKNTPSYRIGLYGLLLGTCGRPQDAEVLRKIIESPDTRPLTGIDGLMGGYCVLDPKNGPEYVLGVLTDSTNDFNVRYAALRTVRFLLTEMKRQVDSKLVFGRMTKAILIPDISDLIIDEFRKSQQWGPTDLILSHYGKAEFDLQVIRRAIIRFALKCPEEKAKSFIADLKKKDPQLIADVEEILKFEEAQTPSPPAAAASK
jgi:hypothetical protein